MRSTFALAAALFLLAAAPPDHTPLRGAKQLILVITPDWNATTGTMTRYDLRNNKWRAAAAPTTVVIGRSGLAWGRGINHDTGSGPVKHEGDGKSPAGVFHIGAAFGFGNHPEWIRMPYEQLRETTECVDDASSKYYNRITNRSISSDWKSSEKMRSIDVYRWGAVVVVNDPPQPGAGSCIFLHLVDPNAKPTSGCTSMSPEAMDALLHWVVPVKRPLLVQLPRSEYNRLRAAWRLP